MAIRPPPHQSALRLTASPQGKALGWRSSSLPLEGISPKRRLWRIKQGGIEEGLRLSRPSEARSGWADGGQKVAERSEVG